MNIAATHLVKGELETENLGKDSGPISVLPILHLRIRSLPFLRQ